MVKQCLQPVTAVCLRVRADDVILYRDGWINEKNAIEKVITTTTTLILIEIWAVRTVESY